MLQANKANVVAGLARQNLSLRQLELQYWIEALKKFGTLAAFLGGFASSVMQLQTDVQAAQGFHLVFSLTSAGAMGLNFLVLAICTTCNVWGPGKALIGQGDESYRVVRPKHALNPCLAKPLSIAREETRSADFECWPALAVAVVCYVLRTSKVTGFREKALGLCLFAAYASR